MAFARSPSSLGSPVLNESERLGQGSVHRALQGWAGGQSEGRRATGADRPGDALLVYKLLQDVPTGVSRPISLSPLAAHLVVGYEEAAHLEYDGFVALQGLSLGLTH